MPQYRTNLRTMQLRSYDPELPYLTTIDSLHRLTHDGLLFHHSGKRTGWLDAGVDDFLITTPASGSGHIVNFAVTTGRGDIDILAYEDAVVSANGTELTDVFTTNRNSTVVPETKLYQNPTVTGVGTLIHTSWHPPTGTGTGQSGNGLVGGGPGEEWELKPNANYLLRMTNNSGATIDYRWEYKWYENGYE